MPVMCSANHRVRKATRLRSLRELQRGWSRAEAQSAKAEACAPVGSRTIVASNAVKKLARPMRELVPVEE